MLKTKTKLIALSVATLSILLSGCGGSDASSSDPITSALSGQFVDGYVQGAHYECADGKSGETGMNGEFSCDTMPVTFRLAGLKLGTIANMPLDKHVFPQDLIGVDRNDTNNSEVIAMAQLLQSLDVDDNPDNGIEIDMTAIGSITVEEDFDENNLDEYIRDANVTKVGEDEAKGHLEKTQNQVEMIEQAELPDDVSSALNTVLYTLTDEVKNDLAYMGNEERLAYDIYNKLYTYFPEKQLQNIATNSEIKHIATVKALIQKYDINGTELSVTDVNTSSLSVDVDVNAVGVAGVYDIQVIQDLYDVLLEKGQKSAVDALQVGCMVEVTDITDLDKDIGDAQDSNASDVVSAFEFLRGGSYSHYWAFDSGLKNQGIEDGCCSLGAEYCKTEAEYPKKEKGSSSETHNEGSTQKGEGSHDGNGYRGGM